MFKVFKRFKSNGNKFYRTYNKCLRVSDEICFGNRRARSGILLANKSTSIKKDMPCPIPSKF